MGVISERRKKERAQRARRRLLIAAIVLVIGWLAMPAQLHKRLSELVRAVQVFGGSTQAEFTLPEWKVSALQLGVYDNGERAAEEAQRLRNQGIRCIIWQKEKMRIVADASWSKEELDAGAAGRMEAYVITQTLPEVSVRLTADARSIASAQALFELPDSIFHQLTEEETPLAEIIASARGAARQALTAHPDNTLYTQLAQSLENWCMLMESELSGADAQSLRSYARVTICTLCRELRHSLSAQSTASAQRTPSTAADVMPPA